jgi:carboxyl-terminal processing protease
MKLSRMLPLVPSLLVAAFLVCGSLAARARSEDNSWKQVVLFSEILSLVQENYVDPVEANELLGGAFEGMLAGLDAHGAYLSADEVREWKAFKLERPADPGIAVLKAGPQFQVVGVLPGSPADEQDIEVGDRLRAVDGRPVGELSLSQTWRLLQGEPGSRLRLEVVRPRRSFSREALELSRVVRHGPGWTVRLDRGTAHLRMHDLGRLDIEALARELDDIRSRGAATLLVDLRNLADMNPRDAVRAAGYLVPGAELRLRDRSGRLLETLASPASGPAWAGPLAVLVNGATAGAGEALAGLVRAADRGSILGEATYGLGAEPTLFELEDGTGIVVSARLWETSTGARWHGEGLQPDHEIHGEGEDFAAVSASQLERALDYLEQQRRPADAERQAA